MRLDAALRAQLTRIEEWRRSDGRLSDLGLIDYVGFESTTELLFAFGELFSPQLINYKGARYIAEKFTPETVDDWLARGLSNSEVQAVYNHLHIRTLIQEPMSDELSQAAGERIASIWRLTIPDSKVWVFGDDYDEVAVTFCDLHPDRATSGTEG